MDNLHERPIAGGYLVPKDGQRGISCGDTEQSSCPLLEISTQSASHDMSTMLSFHDFKKSLGIVASNYSDEQIDALRVAFDKIADITFDWWLLQRNTGTMH